MKTLARPGDKDELVRRLRALHPESARRWGRMAAPQMVCHLSDCFGMALGRKPVRPSSGVLQHTIVKWIALYLPLAWPPGIVTSAEIDQEQGGTLPAAFAADVAEAEALLNLVVCATALGAQPHPVFGRMSQADWLRWGYLHTDHHLRQFGV